MTARFTDQVVLVTGAGSGIGRRTARAFAAEGAVVVAAGRRPAPLQETAALIEADGGTVSTATADMSRETDVAELVDTVAHRHGRLDIAVNNAGVFAAGPVAELDLDEWRRLFDINVTGVMLAMKHQVTLMRRQGGGRIVNLGSTLGAHKAVPGLGGYGASKAAVSALSRAVAAEVIADGIRVNVVSPGSSDTSMSYRGGETEDQRAQRIAASVPLGRVGTLDEVSSAILWLASPDSGFAVGHDLVIDGGVSL